MLNIVWAKFEKTHTYNFGDDLTPYLFSKLTDEKFRYIKFANSRFQITKQFINGVLRGKFSLLYLKDFILGFFINEYIVSIGSVLGSYSSKRCIVWGSGIMRKDEKVKKSKFLAVRGEHSLKVLKNMGCKKNVKLGDPSILLPVVYNPMSVKKYKLGVIPHIIHYDYIKNIVHNEDIHVINLNCSNNETIIEEICSCEFIISTSLHGLIVSQVYNIKSLWYEIKSIPLYGDSIKFYDYFSSVKIPDYKPFILTNEINIDDILHNIKTNDEINKINVDLKSLQKGLLEVAPFGVKEEILSKFL